MPEERNSPSHDSPAARRTKAAERTIHSCNFRSAGRISNENARTLTAIHETLARHLASALDAYLGTGVEIKMAGLDQLLVKDHSAAIAPLSYMIPFSLNTPPSTMIVECDISLVYPIVDVLLGGPGGAGDVTRELSEIEEEIMQDTILLIVRQAESAWRMPVDSLMPNRRIKPSMLHQYCGHNEKVTLATFEVTIGGVTGSLVLAFPTAFLNNLIQQLKMDSPQKRGSVRYFPRPGIRERILDCDIEVTAELPTLRVAVKDLIGLQPGSVLKLRAPVRTPGMLTAGGKTLFEASPVRNGSQKAAQLGRRISSASWENV